MAGFQGLQTYTMKASADLSKFQYHLVQQDASKSVDLAVLSTNNNAAGILQNKPGSTQHASIADGGTSKVIAGGAITQGKYFTTSTSGRAITVTSGKMAFGRALETVGASGDLFSARIIVPFRWNGVP